MSPGSYSSSGGGDAEFRSNSDVDAASRYLAEAMQGGGEVRRRVERSSTDEELARIAQAMVFIVHASPIHLSICLANIHTCEYTYVRIYTRVYIMAFVTY